MILNPLLFYIKVVQMMVKKKKSTSKNLGGVRDKPPWTGLKVDQVPIFFYFSDIENKIIGLVL